MKKTGLILFIIFCILTVGLFPLDLFVFEVPEWVVYAFIAADIASLVIFIAGGKTKLPAKIISVFTAAAVSLCAAAGIWIDPYYNSTFLRPAANTLPYDTMISADKACADLDYAMRYLQKNHPAFINGLTPEVRQRYEQVREDFASAGGVTVNEIARRTASVFGMLNDAHTNVFRTYTEPLYLKHYNKWKQEGWSLTALNDIPMKEILVRSADLYSFEAESWELEMLGADVLNVQGLDYLGFSTDDGVTFTFENETGERKSENYFTDDFVTYAEYLEYNGIENTSADNDGFVNYTIDEENSLALLTLDECVFNSEYTDCLRRMFTEVKEKGIRNVAVDLRENGGGSDQTAIEFIRYLDVGSYKIASEYQRLGFFTTAVSSADAVNERYSDLLFTGNVYILTSSGTFSSAMLFAQYIKDNRLGTLIGEPPGNDPNGFGEITMFRMPNSGVRFSVSTKQFYRADRECTDKYVMPDIGCADEEAETKLYEAISAEIS